MKKQKFHLRLYFAIQGTKWYRPLYFVAQCNNKLVLTDRGY